MLLSCSTIVSDIQQWNSFDLDLVPGSKSNIYPFPHNFITASFIPYNYVLILFGTNRLYNIRNNNMIYIQRYKMVSNDLLSILLKISCFARRTLIVNLLLFYFIILYFCLTLSEHSFLMSAVRVQYIVRLRWKDFNSYDSTLILTVHLRLKNFVILYTFCNKMYSQKSLNVKRENLTWL